MDKYSKIKDEIYWNHKLSGMDKTTKATNNLLKEISEMIVEAIKMSDEYEENK